VDNKPKPSPDAPEPTSEQRLRLILSQLPAITWTVDRDLRFTSSLGAGLSALGLHENELRGRTLMDYFQTAEPDFAPLQYHRRALAGRVG
jgi:PAS domain S-box-containing protein